MKLYQIDRAIKHYLKMFLGNVPGTKELMAWRRNRKMHRKQNIERMRSYREEGPGVAFQATAALVNGGMSCWVFAGSLLGIIRDGAFLPWDNDLDLCVLVDKDFSWENVENILEREGYKRIRQFECNGRITEQAYSAGSFHFDIFALEPQKNGRNRVLIYKHLWNERFDSPRKTSVLYLDIAPALGVDYRDVGGYSLPVPRNAEDWLSSLYGPDWKKPDPEYVDGSMFALLENAVGECTLFLE